MSEAIRRPLTPKQAEAFLPFTAQTIKAMLRDGDLRGFKMRGRWFVYPESIDEAVRKAEGRADG